MTSSLPTPCAVSRLSFQNVLENYPPFLVGLALASVHRPILAAVAGLIRLAGFVAYVKGYQVCDDHAAALFRISS